MRTAIVMIALMLAGCGGTGIGDPEPVAPLLNSRLSPQAEDTPAAAETVVYEPAEPVIVDMSEPGGPAQAEEEQEMESEGQEAPAPGQRDPLANLVEQARQTLAERIGITVGEVTVESTEDVTWPDTSLGCPDPEMMYAQMLTPGYRIVLEAGGETYTYHASERGHLVLCGQDGRPAR